MTNQTDPGERQTCSTKYANYCRNCLYRGKCGRDVTLPTASPLEMLRMDLGDFGRLMVSFFFA